MVTGPPGAGPPVRPAGAAPGEIAAAGTIPVASPAPVFVTVSVTVSAPPPGTSAGAAAAAASPEGAPIRPGPATSGCPLFTSAPVTVSVKSVLPPPVTVYDQVRERLAPPASVVSTTGAASSVSPPVPARTGSPAGASIDTVACPVFDSVAT